MVAFVAIRKPGAKIDLRSQLSALGRTDPRHGCFGKIGSGIEDQHGAMSGDLAGHETSTGTRTTDDDVVGLRHARSFPPSA